MKHLGIGFGISGLLLFAACSVDDPVATPGTAGSGGSATTAGTTSGGTATGGSSAGSGMTAGTTAGGSSAGTAAGGSSAGSGGSAAGSGGSAGSGGGSGGGGACDTKLGKAIHFTQAIDMVAGDLGADATLGDKPRTLELWGKFEVGSWAQEFSIIEIGKPATPDNHNNVFGIDMSGRKGAGGAFGPYIHGASDNNGQAVFLDNTPEAAGWLHLSWAYDPTKTPLSARLEFTVNGDVIPVEFTQSEWDKTGMLVGNTGYVLLGASQNFGHAGWTGAMDEVRLWSVYRTPQQIKDSMKQIVKPDTAGLIAYYQFNEGDAANVTDSTKKATHKLAACTAAGGACGEANKQAPTFVESDIPGPFTCAP
jgi:Concanavalin A-like lectin/glucanases superfamily